MKKKSPAFQFYPKDWLSSQKISLMTPAEEGAYIRLLCYCWDDPDCSIIDNDEVLASISRLGEGWLKGGSKTLRKCFILHPEKQGYLTNLRLLEEKKKQETWIEKSRVGGIKSWETRSTKASKRLKGGSKMVRTKREPKSKKWFEPKSNIAFAFASNIKDIKNISLITPIPPFLSEQDWCAFVEHRKAIKAPMSEQAQIRMISRLEKLHQQGNDVSRMIDQSIINNWKDIFPVRQNNSTTGESKHGNRESTNNISKSQQSWGWFEKQLEEVNHAENIHHAEDDLSNEI